jgi:hypothetical protein
MNSAKKIIFNEKILFQGNLGCEIVFFSENKRENMGDIQYVN